MFWGSKMLKNIIIIGAGGVGRETALIIEDINNVNKEWNIIGFVDDNDDIQNTKIDNYHVVGKLDYILNYEKEVYVVCAIANYNVKKSIVNKLKSNKNIKFATLIHPSTILNRTVEVGEGCIIYQNVIVTTNVTIGNHVIVSPKAGIGHDTVVKDYCNLLWNVNISGNVVLKEGVLVGSGATVIQGLEIGEGATLGAGAVVIRDIPMNKVAVGNPTRLIAN